MSYSNKIAELVKLVAPRVRFTSLDHAEEIATWYNQPHTSEVYQKVHRLADNLLRRQERYGLTAILETIGECRQTKLSALREAIMLNAVHYFVECSADKVMCIVEIIEPLVQFDDVDQAKEYASWETTAHDSDITREVYNMAETLLSREEALGLTWILESFGGSTHTKLSALREAIKRTAERHVTRVELEELAKLGDIDKSKLLVATA